MKLAGDVGGTKVLLQLSAAGGGRGADAGVLFERRYQSAAFANFAEVVRAFMGEFVAGGGRRDAIRSACFGVAGPVSGERVRLTNLPWIIDARELSGELGAARVRLVNDFEATAHGIDALEPGELVTLQAGQPEVKGNRVVLGAGTGFGVAYSIFTEAGYRVVAGEGGHMGFAPADDIQAAFCRDIREREGRASVEQVLSGPGLVRAYHFFLRRDAVESIEAGRGVEAETVIAGARGGRDAAAQSALELWVAAYGAVAGDHALAVLASGGIYVCGGIAPAILPELASGAFLASFLAKGPHAAWMRRIPVHVVTDPRLCLHGARILAGQP